MVYTINDLHVRSDPVQMLRDMSGYLRSGPRLELITSGMVRQIILSGVPQVFVNIEAPWGMISASRDWLANPSGGSELSFFHKLARFNPGGQNDVRYEIYFTAFASAVFTDGIDGATWIKGDEAATPIPSSIRSQGHKIVGGRIMMYSIPEIAEPIAPEES